METGNSDPANSGIPARLARELLLLRDAAVRLSLVLKDRQFELDSDLRQASVDETNTLLEKLRHAPL